MPTNDNKSNNTKVINKSHKIIIIGLVTPEILLYYFPF